MSDLKADFEKRQLFAKLLDLLVVFNSVCQQNGIKYFVFGGTMLGAVRHKGFIPWDDDVDVVLFREDYNKLKEVALKGAFKFPYFLQDPSTDIGYPKGYCRLRNSITTEIPIFDVYEKCNHGIFIDVFPLDQLPDDDLQLRKQINKLKRLRMLMNAFSRYYSHVEAEGASTSTYIAYKMLSLLFKSNILNMSDLYKRYEETATKYSAVMTNRVGTIAGTFDNNRFIFDQRPWLSKTIWLDFEKIKVPVPEAYDEILKHSYGDYMVPKKEKTLHGETFFSATIPYEKYTEENKQFLLGKRFEMTDSGRKRKRNN